MAVHKRIQAGRTATVVWLVAAARLHRSTGLVAGNSIRGDSFVVDLVEHPAAVGIVSRQVQQVDSGENDQESTQQRDCVDGIGGVESLEQNKRCAQRGGRERDIVQRVNTDKLAKVLPRIQK